MNDRAFGECVIIIAERIDRDHGVVGERDWLEYRRNAFVDALARIDRWPCSERYHHRAAMIGEVLSIRIGLYESALVRHIAVVHVESAFVCLCVRGSGRR